MVARNFINYKINCFQHLYRSNDATQLVELDDWRFVHFFIVVRRQSGAGTTTADSQKLESCADSLVC